MCFKSNMTLEQSFSHADVKVPKHFLIRRSRSESHDFAMAILKREVTFTNSIRPICIPKQVRMWVLHRTAEKTKLQNMDFYGSKATAAGWGS